MTTYWHDLQVLSNIIDTLEPEYEEPFNDEDIEQFKESVQYFIEDFVDTNIKLYKKKYFENMMYDALYEMISTSYGTIIDKTNFDLEYHIYDAMEIYFHKNNAFRSYSGTTILKKPNKKHITKLLKSYTDVELPNDRVSKSIGPGSNSLSSVIFN